MSRVPFHRENLNAPSQVANSPQSRENQQSQPISQEWISLMDYANKTGVSLSTLRRHIKAGKIPYRVENGRYLLMDQPTEAFVETPAPHRYVAPVQEEGLAPMQIKVSKLEKDLRRAQEEIAELKTLIAFYEEKISPSKLDS